MYIYRVNGIGNTVFNNIFQCLDSVGKVLMILLMALTCCLYRVAW